MSSFLLRYKEEVSTTMLPHCGGTQSKTAVNQEQADPDPHFTSHNALRCSRIICGTNTATFVANEQSDKDSDWNLQNAIPTVDRKPSRVTAAA